MSMFRHSLRVLQRTSTFNAPSVLANGGCRNFKRWVAPTLHELKKRRDKLGPEKEQPRSTYLEWNYDAELFAFGKRLSEEFKPHLLRRALTHRSYVVEQELKATNKEKATMQDNKEFITIGEDIITHCINMAYQNDYPNVVVNSIHNYLKKDSLLAHISRHIGLKDIVLCSDFPVEDKTLADSFKAIVAAVEKSSGSEQAEKFVKDFLLVELHDKDLFEIWDPKNSYEYLENMIKEKGMSEIEPRLCNKSAISTILANYQVGLYTDKKLLGIGWGESIEIAKETAAFDAIKKLYTSKV